MTKSPVFRADCYWPSRIHPKREGKPMAPSQKVRLFKLNVNGPTGFTSSAKENLLVNDKKFDFCPKRFLSTTRRVVGRILVASCKQERVATRPQRRFRFWFYLPKAAPCRVDVSRIWNHWLDSSSPRVQDSR